MRIGNIRRAGLVAAAMLFVVAGCAKKERESREIDVEGTVESIDLANRVVQVSTYVEKAGGEQRFPVKVTDETEILINGAISRLEDVNVGERAKGTIRVVRQNGKRVYIARQVRINREEVIVAPGATQDAAAAPPPDAPAQSPTPAGTNG